MIPASHRSLPWTHRQWGAWFGSLALPLVALLIALAPGALAWAIAGLVVIVLAQFLCLTVSVDRAAVRIAFGPGWIRHRIPLAEIRSFQRVRNAWYWGWGIRFYPGGRLYSVSGLDAVELELRGDRRLRIGTDRPDELIGALQAATGQSARPTGAPGLPHPRSARRRYRGLVAVLLLVPIALGVVCLLEEREPRIEVEPELVSVSSFLYSAELPLREIDGVTLLSELPRLRLRTNGYALGATLRGHFTSDDGPLLLFVEADRPPFVQLRGSSRTVCFNLTDEARTRALHAEIAERLR